MSRRRKILILLLGFLVLAVIFPVFAASNTIRPGRADIDSDTVNPEELKPSECAGITVTNLVVGGNGTAGNDLIFGTAGNDNLNGQGGNDCIVGGAGDDTLKGGSGDDILLGGPGIDDLDGGQDTAGDICDGGPGIEDPKKVTKCETIYNVP